MRTWHSKVARTLEARQASSQRHSYNLNEARMEIDLPEVVAEVTAAFERYEQALVSNDVAVLDSIFHDDAALPSAMAVARISMAIRRSRPFAPRARQSGPHRTLSKTVITTYGRGFCGGLDPVSPSQHAWQGRPADADLGALPRRLACRRRACQRHRRADCR